MTVSLRRPPTTLTIGQLCREFEVTPRTLRYYEEQGLLEPARRDQQRIYSRRDRARLQLILRGKRVGLALSEIGEILDLYEVDDGGAAQNIKSLTKFRERIVALEAQRQDIDKAIEELRSGCDALEGQLARTRPDLLPRAADYDQVLRARLGDLEHAK